MNTKSATFSIKSTGLHLFIILSIFLSLTSCSGANKNTQADNKTSDKAFCYKGGRSNDYSCDVDAQIEESEVHAQDIDEDWMYQTLGEIKKWLKEEKKLLESSSSSKQKDE